MDRYPRYPISSRDEYFISERVTIDKLLNPRRNSKVKPQRNICGPHNIYDIDIVKNPFGRAFR
jgi:hypothetical protein